MTTITNIAQRILEENNFVVDASSVNITAQNILDENKWTINDVTLANLEAIMGNTINYVNLEANTTIAPMSGTSESKIATLSKPESLAVKLWTSLLVRAYKDKGPNAVVGSVSVATTINDPQYNLFTDIAQKAINRLKTANPIFLESLITNAISIINLHAGLSIAALSGTAGNKSLTATDNQIVVIKLVASRFLQNHIKGRIGDFSITKTLETSINRLKGGSLAFVVGDDTSGLT